MFGVKKFEIRKSPQSPRATEIDITLLVAERSALPKRLELPAIGLVMLLQNIDPALAAVYARKMGVDEEKLKAIMGLIGCVDDEPEEEAELLMKAGTIDDMGNSYDEAGILLGDEPGTILHGAGFTPQWVGSKQSTIEVVADDLQDDRLDELVSKLKKFNHGE